VDGGDLVSNRSRVTGTNQGGFPPVNIPVNGKPLSIDFWSIYRFEDGKVVEHEGINDGLSRMMQLGALGG
jgi:predicted ester cyclase